MTSDELHRFLVEEFPQSDPEWMRIEQVSERYVRVRSLIGDGDLRPGGTVSATTLMSLADLSMYLVVISSVGRDPLALATNLNINFLRRPTKADLIAEAKIIKLGRRLVIGEVSIFSHGIEEIAALATVTYSLPPRESTSEPH